MAVVRRSHSDRRETRHFSSERRISPLEILQARFQQKQLQEKERKLLKLYEEQQERALKSVGSRSHSGGSSVSSNSSVGVGKVRHMFQSRRENSEPRLGVTITGRDKSHPLQPLTKYPTARHTEEGPHDDRHSRYSTSRAAHWGSTQQERSLSLDRNDNRRDRHDNRRELDVDENYNKITVRRTQSQVRSQRPKPRREEREDLENDDRGYSFQLVDNYSTLGNEYLLLRNFNTKRQSYEKREEGFQVRNKPDSVELSDQQRSRMESRYKNYVSQTTFGKKVHLGNGAVTAGRSPGMTGRQTTEVKESSSGYLNGSVSSPVRKIRKPTPVPLSVAPPQHLLQKEIRKTTRIETIREVPSSVPSQKPLASRVQSSAGSVQKPPTPGKSIPSSRVSPTKPASTSVARSTAPPSDLVNCRICGRHFAADRVSKHEEVCQKSSRNKRKPFDALQQRVKGTEVEQFIKKGTKASRGQPEKVAKPQSNWRKKHEEFINNIRAAKEVSAHLKKGGKLSDLPPPPPSDYSDYVPCPHCGRKFNSSAAERHIPKCANIINNKPKPNVQKTGGLKQSSKLLHPASTSVRGRK